MHPLLPPPAAASPATDARPGLEEGQESWRVLFGEEGRECKGGRGRGGSGPDHPSLACWLTVTKISGSSEQEEADSHWVHTISSFRAGVV